MKVALLTTQTPHHAYFVRELVVKYKLHVFCEVRGSKPPFETAHPFEQERDAYECQCWFGGGPHAMEQYAPVTRFDNLNSLPATAALATFGADVALVFGTGRLSQAVIEAGPPCFLNLHGGNPEDYRGLDTHLWAIYHEDFGALATTLHYVNSSLDDGDICQQEDLKIAPGMPLHALRRSNSETCVRLALSALAIFNAIGDVPRRRQQRKGRYYSFMPSVLKSVCQVKFERFTRGMMLQGGRIS